MTYVRKVISSKNHDFLSIDDIELIESTGLSISDKHFLRVMGHCLASFKSMSNGSKRGPFPTDQSRIDWLLKQGDFQKDDPFLLVLLEQLVSAANQLELIADHFQISPLELTIKSLIEFIKKDSKKK